MDNMHEESVVAQRVVYDGVHDAGGIMSVNVTKAMMQSVHSARSRYDDALKRHREEATEEKKREAEKRRIAAEIKSLEAKKAKLMNFFECYECI